MSLAKCSYALSVPFLDFCKSSATAVLSGHCIDVVLLTITGVFHHILCWKYLGITNPVLDFLVK